MKTWLDCVPCFLRQSIEAARSASEDVLVHERIVRDVLEILSDLDFARTPPVVVQAIHRRIRELTGVEDPYEAAKTRFNRLAMDALPALTELVRAAGDPLLAAARCAVAANAIDTGAASSLGEADVRAALQGLPEQSAHGNWLGFAKAASRARRILYLADNAGELAVDRLVVQALGAKRVTVVVRGGAVLNDATRADAREVGMDDLAEVIDNGSDAPGTVLEDCSEAFRERFASADLIIAKGQGNFETLSDSKRTIAFWFKVKCPLVAHETGLPVGTHALLWRPDECPAHISAHQGGARGWT
jgi:damage-control phosphatase, subfamily I